MEVQKKEQLLLTVYKTFIGGSANIIRDSEQLVQQ